MSTHIKLHGTKAERFETIKLDLSQRMGYELSNPEVLGLLMADLDTDTGLLGQDDDRSDRT